MKGAALAAALLVATSQPAISAVCEMRDTIVTRLADKYSESLVAGGLQGTRQVQTMVEIWASEDTGTFTVILTNPQGVSCIVATGANFFNHRNSQLQGEDM